MRRKTFSKAARVKSILSYKSVNEFNDNKLLSCNLITRVQVKLFNDTVCIKSILYNIFVFVILIFDITDVSLNNMRPVIVIDFFFSVQPNLMLTQIIIII